MARTKRKNPFLMSRSEFMRLKSVYQEFLPRWKDYTYEKYVHEETSDKYMRRQPSSNFRRMINRKTRAKLNQTIQKNIKKDDDIILPTIKRSVRWEWF